MTWWLVTMIPVGSMMTPEPSDCWTRWPGAPRSRSPKKRRKNGSETKGEADSSTTREA
jgi:hypothetical protein